MSSIGKIYTREVKKHFRKLRANWEPGEQVELGDFGIMTSGGHIFQRLGNIKRKFNIDFDIRQDPTKDHKWFASSRGVSVKFNAKGQLDNPASPVTANARVKVEFSKEKAVFFNAAQCTTTSVEDKLKLSDAIFKLYKQGKWKKRYVVITDLVTAGKTMIAISSSSDSEFVVEAESKAIKTINLADASIGLTVSAKKNVGYSVDAKNGLIPLIGLSKLQSKFLGLGTKPELDVNVLNKTMTSDSLPFTIGEIDSFYEEHPDTQEQIENLYFGEYLED